MLSITGKETYKARYARPRIISELFSKRYVQSVERRADVSTFWARGVILESIVEGIEAQAFSSKM